MMSVLTLFFKLFKRLKRHPWPTSQRGQFVNTYSMRLFGLMFPERQLQVYISTTTLSHKIHGYAFLFEINTRRVGNKQIGYIHSSIQLAISVVKL